MLAEKQEIAVDLENASSRRVLIFSVIPVLHETELEHIRREIKEQIDTGLLLIDGKVTFEGSF